MAAMPVIIISTLWASPSILSQFLLNMYLIAVLTTVATVFVMRWILRVNKTFKVSRRFKKAVMTLCMWIKSHIKADKVRYGKRRHKRTYQRRTQSRYCKRYYIYASKTRPTRIATKTARYVVRPRLFANSSQNVPGKRRDRPQDAIFDSDSFLIQIDSGASRSISNKREHFESIEPLNVNKLNRICGPTGEESPIKGKGTLNWKIEDDDGVVHTIKLKDSLYVPNFTNCLLCTQV